MATSLKRARPSSADTDSKETKQRSIFHFFRRNEPNTEPETSPSPPSAQSTENLQPNAHVPQKSRGVDTKTMETHNCRPKPVQGSVQNAVNNFVDGLTTNPFKSSFITGSKKASKRKYLSINAVANSCQAENELNQSPCSGPGTCEKLRDSPVELEETDLKSVEESVTGKHESGMVSCLIETQPVSEMAGSEQTDQAGIECLTPKISAPTSEYVPRERSFAGEEITLPSEYVLDDIGKRLLGAFRLYDENKPNLYHYRGYDLHNIVPEFLVHRNIRVYWPDDDLWYSGKITHYDEGTCKHTVQYLDGEVEELLIGEEKVKVESFVGEIFPVEIKPKLPKVPSPVVESSGPKPAMKAPVKKGYINLMPEELVDKKCTVYWPLDKTHYRGKVISYNPIDGIHQVVYDDDGIVENRNFRLKTHLIGLRLVGKDGVDMRLDNSDWPPLKSQEEVEGAQGATTLHQQPGAQGDDMVEVKVNELDDPSVLTGARVAVYWPLDDVWYKGHVSEYNARTHRHQVKYDDGEHERVRLEAEKVKVEPAYLHLFPSAGAPSSANTPAEEEPVQEGSDQEEEDPSLQETGASAVPLPGEVVFAQFGRHPAWPSVAITEVDAVALNLGPPASVTRVTTPVLFFGTFEFARLGTGRLHTVPEALNKGFHRLQKTAKLTDTLHKAFQRGLDQMVTYLETGELPEEMGGGQWEEPVWVDEDEEEAEAEAIEHQGLVDGKAWPRTISANITVCNPGVIEYLHPDFHNSKYIYPVGYKILRKYESFLDHVPGKKRGAGPPPQYELTCEILYSNAGPLFQITLENGTQFVESTPGGALTLAWRELGAWLKESSGAQLKQAPAGNSFFGFCSKAVARILQSLPESERCEGYHGWLGPRPRVPPPNAAILRMRAAKRAKALTLPPDITPVQAPVNLGARCSICNSDEEYHENQFVQCDKCGVMVHMDCYGITKPPDGGLWLCNLCPLGLDTPPPCALCPTIGGAMKPTTCHRWAHVTCAIWVPEVSFGCVELMEPIMGADRIPKSRANLKCDICRQRYGACIQCASLGCFASYHPLCARKAGYEMQVKVESARDTEVDDKRLTVQQRLHRGLDVGNGLRLLSKCGRCAAPALPASPYPSSSSSHQNHHHDHSHSQDSSQFSLSGPHTGDRHHSLLCNPDSPPPLKNEGEGEGEGGGGKGEGGGGVQSLSTPQTVPTLPPMSPLNSTLKAVMRELDKVEGNMKGHCEEDASGALGDGGLARRALLPGLEGGQDASCARARGLDHTLLRNRREPAALAAALAKRTFVRSTPYLVTGRRSRNIKPPPLPPPVASSSFTSVGDVAPEESDQVSGKEKPRGQQESTPKRFNYLHPGQGVLSLTEKYFQMRRTQGSRITMGKSAIHGWGVFTKLKHAQNAMVVEYGGEAVRPPVADLRERSHYNSLVGAGTYIFAMDGNRVVDATKSGTIAHLINHSCEPNCFTRIVNAGGDSRIIIFALRDLEVGVELTYDYRFASQNEMLPCNCGASKCRGMVNIQDPDGEFLVKRSEVTPYFEKNTQ